MKIYLIRHGQTTGDVEDRYGGDYDDYLTEKGRQQALELSNKLKNKDIQAVFHSPRIRATETAKILAEKLNISLRAIQDIRERNSYGVLTGLIKSDAKKKYPEEVDELNKDKINHKVTGSEDYSLFKKRVIDTFNKLATSNYNTIAVVSHGGVISCFVREILRLGEFKSLGDCAFLEIEKIGDDYKLLSLTGAKLT